jgi:hypothetical protein
MPLTRELAEHGICVCAARRTVRHTHPRRRAARTQGKSIGQTLFPKRMGKADEFASFVDERAQPDAQRAQPPSRCRHEPASCGLSLLADRKTQDRHIADYFDVAARVPEREVFVDDTQCVDYATAQRLAHAVAHGLTRALGLGRGAHVGVYSPNSDSVDAAARHQPRGLRLGAGPHAHRRDHREGAAYADTGLVFFHSASRPRSKRLARRCPQVSTGSASIVIQARPGPRRVA